MDSVVLMDLMGIKVAAVINYRVETEITAYIAPLSGKLFPVVVKFRAVTVTDKTGKSEGFHNIDISAIFPLGDRADNPDIVRFKTIEEGLETGTRPAWR